jgi:hypothetical protein
MGPAGNLAEASSLQPTNQRASVVHPKLDLDFLVGWHKKIGVGLRIANAKLRTSDFGVQCPDCSLEYEVEADLRCLRSEV